LQAGTINCHVLVLTIFDEGAYLTFKVAHLQKMEAV